MTYEQLTSLDIKTVISHCRFYLVRKRPGLSMTQPFAESDFERLKLIRVVKVPDVEREVGTFMRRNNLELEFSGDESWVSSKHEHLRMSSFLVLQLPH